MIQEEETGPGRERQQARLPSLYHVQNNRPSGGNGT